MQTNDEIVGSPSALRHKRNGDIQTNDEKKYDFSLVSY